MAVEKRERTGSKKVRNPSRTRRTELYLDESSALIQALHSYVASLPEDVRAMSLENLRKLLDEELGEKTLTEELYRMRRESP